ncbi:Maf family protein [Inhella gelatinilytica]|uniref:7-methyl-GTP pyrophosphatase n=1 Tax=Inhella gelatinilytica TaxID=2795030 RepID=A0A931NDP8_9BURK|nr:Maf family nucleotide pyrophosphatase [Inhella gelatinilytica]MBH9553307.1 septum formation inhibitor Maf [Inhella gelatinilytica]
MQHPLILASTSRYRRELLERLHLPFSVHPPHTDETPRDHESPAELAVRLAIAKARAVAQAHPEAWVIGSDQVADLNGEPIGKPGDLERAQRQLERLSGQTVVFQTGLALVNHARQWQQSVRVPVRVRFRTLTPDAIARYLALEPAIDCAGSAKSEGLGIALLETIESDDPTALIGLPLIALTRLLREAGLDPLST